MSSASPRGRPSPYAEESTVGKHWSPMLAQQSPRQSKPPPRAPRISPTGHTAGFHPNEHMGMGDNTGLEQQGAVYHEETDPLNPMIDISVDESLQQPPSRALSDDDDDDDDEVGHGYGNGADEGQGAGAAHVDGDTAAAHGHETAVQEPTHSGADQRYVVVALRENIKKSELHPLFLMPLTIYPLLSRTVPARVPARAARVLRPLSLRTLSAAPCPTPFVSLSTVPKGTLISQTVAQWTTAKVAVAKG